MFLCTAPGRIVFPDDEIAFQTTRSIWEGGHLAVEGIPKRTGELPGRPDGTFGWAHGRDGKRYGFFGHAISVAALPAYGMGRTMAARSPKQWRHAIRSDHYYLHPRSQIADWTRLMVSLTNVVVTALAAVTLALWIGLLGFTRRTATIVGLIYALGTSAWPYSRTFLSEPLSALGLLLCACAIARFHRDDDDRWLWVGGLLGGLAVHIHVLNLIAVPCFIGYAMVPLWRSGRLAQRRKAWIGALVAGAIALALLGVSHYMRFGNPWETGRYGHYSEFVLPGEGLAAVLIGPGRSFWFYSPPLLLALVALRPMWRRDRIALGFAIAIVLTRLLFVACRSDWWGGWALGPRYLVPVIPFALLPIAVIVERFWDLRLRSKLFIGLGLLASVAMQFYYSLHSIFEWMMRVSVTSPEGVPYLRKSHWDPGTMALFGFGELSSDVLLVGAVRLAGRGHVGMAAIFAGVVLVGIGAAVLLVRRLRR